MNKFVSIFTVMIDSTKLYSLIGLIDLDVYARSHGYEKARTCHIFLGKVVRSRSNLCHS